MVVLNVIKTGKIHRSDTSVCAEHTWKLFTRVISMYMERKTDMFKPRLHLEPGFPRYGTICYRLNLQSFLNILIQELSKGPGEYSWSEYYSLALKS